MVCTFGRGRMACMVRLLDVGSFPEKSTEEATNEKTAIQTIYRQFCDADEPNLIEEKECCRSINSKEDAAPVLGGGTNRKKPPKKGRKRVQAINGRETQRSDTVIGGNVAAPELNLDSQNGMLHSLSGEAQRMAASVGHGTVPDSSRVRHGSINCSGPLATKIYHSQGSHRLRTALGHLYQQSICKRAWQ